MAGAGRCSRFYRQNTLQADGFESVPSASHPGAVSKLPPTIPDRETADGNVGLRLNRRGKGKGRSRPHYERTRSSKPQLRQNGSRTGGLEGNPSPLPPTIPRRPSAAVNNPFLGKKPPIFAEVFVRARPPEPAYVDTVPYGQNTVVGMSGVHSGKKKKNSGRRGR